MDSETGNYLRCLYGVYKHLLLSLFQFGRLATAAFSEIAMLGGSGSELGQMGKVALLVTMFSIGDSPEAPLCSDATVLVSIGSSNLRLSWAEQVPGGNIITYIVANLATLGRFHRSCGIILFGESDIGRAGCLVLRFTTLGFLRLIAVNSWPDRWWMPSNC